MPFPIVGGIMAGLGTLVTSRLGHWVVAGMLFLGLQFGAQQFLMTPVLNVIQAQFAGLPSQVIEWMAFLNVDKYITIVLSAYVSASATSALRLQRRPA